MKKTTSSAEIFHNLINGKWYKVSAENCIDTIWTVKGHDRNNYGNITNINFECYNRALGYVNRQYEVDNLYDIINNALEFGYTFKAYENPYNRIV